MPSRWHNAHFKSNSSLIRDRQKICEDTTLNVAGWRRRRRRERVWCEFSKITIVCVVSRCVCLCVCCKRGQQKVSRTTLYSIIPTTLPPLSRPGARPHAFSLLWSKWTGVKDTSLLTAEQNQLQASKESSLTTSLQGRGLKSERGSYQPPKTGGWGGVWRGEEEATLKAQSGIEHLELHTEAIRHSEL